MPSSFRASLERGCAPRETPDPPREKPPCPPLPGRAASLCAAPARRDSSSAIRLELPPPRLCAPRGPEGEPGRMDPAPPPVRGWTTQRGADGSRWVANDAQSLPCSRCCDPSSCELRWIPIPARPHAHPQSRLRRARHPSRLLSSPLPDPQSVACRGSGRRQALGDGGEQENGSGIQFTCSVPAGSRRSAALGSGRAAGTQPGPRARGRGLQPCARRRSRAGWAGRVERDGAVEQSKDAKLAAQAALDEFGVRD